MTEPGNPALRICVVTPVFNSARYLPQTLASVKSQTLPSFEYRVRDSESTDGSQEILRANSDWISRVTIAKDKGMYAALDAEFRCCRADALGWLNADDLLFPWALELVELFFRAFPNCEWVTGIPSVVDHHGRLAWVAHVAPYYRRTWIARGWYSDIGLGTIQQESTFFRRSLYERAGGLNTEMRWGGDMDLWRRFAACGADLWQMGTVLSAFRQHGANASKVHRLVYLREAGAKRIICGKLIAAVYSFACLLMSRCVGGQQARDLLLKRTESSS